MKIGVFDSGLGGITVLSEALRMMPDEDYLYYADTRHVPYGEKPKEAVKRYVEDAVEELVGKGIDGLVIACNTATSIAVKALRSSYTFPIVGMEPAVKPAVLKNSGSGKRVLVFATNLTLKEAKFRELVTSVDTEHIVDFMALPELVTLAEELAFEGDAADEVLRRKLSEFDLGKYGTVVLGCTHFPLFKKNFQRLLPNHIDLIDGAYGTVRHLRKNLEAGHLLGGGSGRLEFLSSGDVNNDRKRFETALSYYHGQHQ